MWKRLKSYLILMRFDKPIGTFLLLWPTLWALWLADHGEPSARSLLIFIFGTIVMRAAGCIINDIADRHWDGAVSRTKMRPLVTGAVCVREAWLLFGILFSIALGLVLMLNRLTVYLAFVGALLAIFYPYLKRITHLPQVGLGLAFAWSIPLVFTAEIEFIPAWAWLLFVSTVVWTVAYDTIYAMVDRSDDVLVGIKSTAILFGRYDRFIVGMLQIIFMVLLCLLGRYLHLGICYFTGLFCAALFLLYQQILIRHREKTACFQAFRSNHWVGLSIFVGIVLQTIVDVTT